MNYLSSISFPNIETKVDFFLKIKQTIYDFLSLSNFGQTQFRKN